MEGRPEPVATPVDPKGPEKSEFLRFAVDLYNHGFFWESHVYFEALWNAHGRQGSFADFFKGFIKLGAAGVKISIGQKESVIGHLERALELFENVAKTEGKMFLGFSLDVIIEKVSEAKNVTHQCPEIYPSWS